MNSSRGLFSGKRQAPTVTVLPGMQMLTPCYILMQVQQAVVHGLKELKETNPRHAMIEVALMSYLIGLGFDYRTARAVVETWETDENLLLEGFLSEETV